MEKVKKGVRLENISKIYQDPKTGKDFYAVHDANLDIAPGSFVTLLGPSGCGKTTLLRMIAGFNSIEGGDIFFNEKRINDMDPSKRNIGMVFQNYAIFPHMTVAKNVAYGLKNRKTPKDEIARETDRFLEIMQIKQYADRLPENLSGGQQQRVALARALVIKPDVLLMDEPLSNLDAKLRVKMRVEIRRIQQELGFTAIYVTHDQEECFAISDKVAIMNKGVIEQMDAPSTIYNSPNTEFIARFVGFENFFELTRAQGGDFAAADGTVIRAADRKPGERFKGCIRPEDVQIVPPSVGMLTGLVREVIFKGVHFEMHVDVEGYEWIIHSTQASQPGELIGMNIGPDEIHIMKRSEV